FITAQQLQEIIPNKEERHIIKQLSILKKNFTKDEPVFQFLHNNYNEHLSADALKNLELQKILDLISFEDLESENINPLWKNTISFLCDLRKNHDLIELLIETDPGYLLHFEQVRLSNQQRIAVFKKIFEKYASRNIWLDVNAKDLADVARVSEVYEYLLEYTMPDKHFVQRYNALSVLQYFVEFKEDRLLEMLLSVSTDIAENDDVRALSIYSLAKLGAVSKTYIERVKKVSNEKEKPRLQKAFYEFLSKSSDIDEYTDLILDAIPLIRFSLNQSISMSSYSVLDCLKNIHKPDCVSKIVRYFIQETEALNDNNIDRYLPHLVKKSIATYQVMPEIYEDMKTLLLKCVGLHLKKAALEIRDFFVSTNTQASLFNEHYKKLVSNEDYRLIGLLMNEEFAERIIHDYIQKNLTEQNIWSILIGTSISKPEEHEHYKTLFINRTNISVPISIDYNKKREEELKEQVHVTLSKDLYLKEIQSVYIGENKNILSHDDVQFDILWDNERGEYKYKDFIVWFLQNSLEKQSLTFTEIIAWSESSRFDEFVLSEVYRLMSNNLNIELDREQIQKISTICYEKINQIDFRTAIEYRDNGYSATNLAVCVWFFRHKYQLDYPESTLLDMLSFDWPIGNDDFGIKYIEDLVSIEKITSRIVENLRERKVAGQVLINHLDYCERYQVKSSIDFVKQFAGDLQVPARERKRALETLIALGIEHSYLLDILQSTDDEDIFAFCAKQLLNLKVASVEDVLLSIIDKDSHLSLPSSYFLMEKQNLQAISYFIHHIEKLETYQTSFDRRPLLLIKTVDAVELLLDLLLKVMNQELKQDDSFHRIDQQIYDVLKQIALQGKEEMQRVVTLMKTFITSNPTITNIHFLYVIHDDIIKLYKINYNKFTHNRYSATIRTANQLLNVPEDEEYQEKLIRCVKTQKEIIEKSRLKSLPEIFTIDPNIAVGAAHLVRLPLSKDQSQFERFINYMQQIFYEPIVKEKRKPSQYVTANFQGLVAIIDLIRCVRHYYHHSKLSDVNVKQLVEGAFTKIGGEPRSPEKWTLFHSIIIDDLLAELSHVERQL
ncbi:hypothetical protein, partial [Paenibacillus tyrfis]|uniref:hypothetical protein n=1 Tax=Paenibacillus tyrfis TaxID=1501230 RepID=UPI002492055A